MSGHAAAVPPLRWQTKNAQRRTAASQIVQARNLGAVSPCRAAPARTCCPEKAETPVAGLETARASVCRIFPLFVMDTAGKVQAHPGAGQAQTSVPAEKGQKWESSLAFQAEYSENVRSGSFELKTSRANAGTALPFLVCSFQYSYV